MQLFNRTLYENKISMKSLQTHVLEELDSDNTSINTFCETILLEFIDNLNDVSESPDSICLTDEKRSELLEAMNVFTSNLINEKVTLHKTKNHRVRNFLTKHATTAKHAVGSFLHSMWHDPHISSH